MEKVSVSNVSSYTDRRLHPVRLAIGHLNRLLAANRGSASLSMDRSLLESVTATLEIFLEDFEANCVSSAEKKTVETPRVTQTRIG